MGTFLFFFLLPPANPMKYPAAAGFHPNEIKKDFMGQAG
jgi:hypothetical protein